MLKPPTTRRAALHTTSGNCVLKPVDRASLAPPGVSLQNARPSTVPDTPPITTHAVPHTLSSHPGT
eukprot:7160956-Prymnesium_polylepis.1